MLLDYLYLFAVTVLVIDGLAIILLTVFVFLFYKPHRIVQRFINWAFYWIMRKIIQQWHSKFVVYFPCRRVIRQFHSFPLTRGLTSPSSIKKDTLWTRLEQSRRHAWKNTFMSRMMILGKYDCMGEASQRCRRLAWLIQKATVILLIKNNLTLVNLADKL